MTITFWFCIFNLEKEKDLSWYSFWFFELPVLLKMFPHFIYIFQKWLFVNCCSVSCLLNVSVSVIYKMYSTYIIIRLL